MMNADYQNSGHVTNGWMDGQTDGYVMSHGDQWALPQTQE
jgi:hypothetical protein